MHKDATNLFVCVSVCLCVCVCVCGALSGKHANLNNTSNIYSVYSDIHICLYTGTCLYIYIYIYIYIYVPSMWHAPIN